MPTKKKEEVAEQAPVQNQELPERLSISTKVINEVLGVLSGMPYNQVAKLIQAVQEDVRAME